MELNNICGILTLVGGEAFAPLPGYDIIHIAQAANYNRPAGKWKTRSFSSDAVSRI